MGTRRHTILIKISLPLLLAMLIQAGLIFSVILFGGTTKQMKENDFRHVYDKDLRAFNVGCMLSYMDYTPRTLEEIMKS